MKTTFGLPKKREQVINLLQQAYVDQNLEEDDYEARLKAAMDAKSLEELQEVIHDFPNAPRLVGGARSQTGQQGMHQQQQNAPLGQSRQQGGFEFPFVFPPRQPQAPSIGGNARRSTVLFGNKNLEIREEITKPVRVATYLGEQKVSLQQASVSGNNLLISVETGLGQAIIDLRGEQLAGKHIQVDIMNVLGELVILLPKGAQVNNQVTPMLGEVSHSYQKVKKWIKRVISGQKALDTTPIPFTVTLYGTCILGEVRLVHD